MLHRVPPWLRAGLVGAAIAGGFAALSGVRFPAPFPWVDIGCDRTTDRYCIGAAIGGFLVAILLLAVASVVVMILVGWALAGLLRVRRSWAVALLGPFAWFWLALIGGLIARVNLFPLSPWAVFPAGIGYGLLGLLLSRPPKRVAAPPDFSPAQPPR